MILPPPISTRTDTLFPDTTLFRSVMVKVLLTTKVNPTYDDLPEDRYHFPRTYLNTIEQAVGDWAIYYEPRRTSGDLSSRGGRMAYFATDRKSTRLNSRH